MNLGAMRQLRPGSPRRPQFWGFFRDRPPRSAPTPNFGGLSRPCHNVPRRPQFSGKSWYLENLFNLYTCERHVVLVEKTGNWISNRKSLKIVNAPDPFMGLSIK